MPNDDKARVRARGTALCPDFDAEECGVRKMIGRTYGQIKPGQWGWTPTGEPVAVTKRAEIARALADGDLWAADEATARWAESVTRKRVAFDPHFGATAPTTTTTTPAPAPEHEKGDGEPA